MFTHNFGKTYYQVLYSRGIQETTMTKLEWEELKLQPDPVYGSPIARSSHGLSVLRQGTLIFIYGGEHTARTPIGQTVWQGDLLKGNWRAFQTANGAETSPCPRIAHAQAAHNDSVVYIFGGRTGVDMHETALNDLWSYNISTNIWTEVQPKGGMPPEARSFHRMICVRDALYVFGGCGSKGRLADWHKFDLATSVWETLVPSTLRGRGGPNLSILGTDQLLVWAGFAGEETNDGQIFDLSTGEWKNLDSQTQSIRPRSVCVAGTLSNGNVIIFGGEVNPSDRGHEGAGGFCQDVLVIKPGGNVSQPQFVQGNELTTVSKVLPCARGWSAGDTAGNSLYLFGGLTGDDTNPSRLSDLWKLTVS